MAALINPDDSVGLLVHGERLVLNDGDGLMVSTQRVMLMFGNRLTMLDLRRVDWCERRSTSRVSLLVAGILVLGVGLYGVSTPGTAPVGVLALLLAGAFVLGWWLSRRSLVVMSAGTGRIEVTAREVAAADALMRLVFEAKALASSQQSDRAAELRAPAVRE